MGKKKFTITLLLLAFFIKFPHYMIVTLCCENVVQKDKFHDKPICEKKNNRRHSCNLSMQNHSGKKLFVSIFFFISRCFGDTQVWKCFFLFLIQLKVLHVLKSFRTAVVFMMLLKKSWCKILVYSEIEALNKWVIKILRNMFWMN